MWIVTWHEKTIKKDSLLHIQGDGIELKHAEIYIKDAGACLQDKGSKHGTFVRNRKVYGKVKLCHGDTIRFGLCDQEFIFEERPLVVVTSCLPSSEKHDLVRCLSNLGGRLDNNWTAECTHLCMKGITVTAKVISCLCHCIPLVLPTYFGDLEIAVTSKARSIGARSLPHCQKLPNASNYLPPVTEPSLLGLNVSFDVNESRKTLLRGKKFYFFSEKQRQKLIDIIQVAGAGAVFIGKSDALPLTDLLDNNAVVMHYSQSAASQLPADNQAWNTGVVEFLKRNGLRCVPDSEISLAIIHVSLETLCNPRSNNNESQNVHSQVTSNAVPFNSAKQVNGSGAKPHQNKQWQNGTTSVFCAPQQNNESNSSKKSDLVSTDAQKSSKLIGGVIDKNTLNPIPISKAHAAERKTVLNINSVRENVQQQTPVDVDVAQNNTSRKRGADTTTGVTTEANEIREKIKRLAVGVAGESSGGVIRDEISNVHAADAASVEMAAAVPDTTKNTRKRELITIKEEPVSQQPDNAKRQASDNTSNLSNFTKLELHPIKQEPLASAVVNDVKRDPDFVSQDDMDMHTVKFIDFEQLMRKEPQAEISFGTVVNFKKFQKAPGQSRRAIPQIIGRSEMYAVAGGPPSFRSLISAESEAANSLDDFLLRPPVADVKPPQNGGRNRKEMRRHDAETVRTEFRSFMVSDGTDNEHSGPSTSSTFNRQKQGPVTSTQMSNRRTTQATLISYFSGAMDSDDGFATSSTSAGRKRTRDATPISPGYPCTGPPPHDNRHAASGSTLKSGKATTQNSNAEQIILGNVSSDESDFGSPVMKRKLKTAKTEMYF